LSSTVSQNGWAFCFKCQGLFYSRNASNGICPKGGAHDSSESGDYSLGFSLAGSPVASRAAAQAIAMRLGGEEAALLARAEERAGQSDWKWCRRCQGLFYAGNGLDKTLCPAWKPHTPGSSRHHDPKGSGDYTLNFRRARSADRAAGQPGWRWCSQCQGLFFAAGGPGVCPKSPPGTHVFESQFANYVVKRANPLADLSPASLLVVAPQVFEDALQPLVDWKNNTSMPTTMVTVEALRDACDGIDDPERVKRGIWQAYVDLGIAYVLLVGDASMFPVRYRFEAQPKDAAIGGQSGWMDGSYNPTDLYYANLVKFGTLFDDWDADDNGKYDRSTWAVNPYLAKQNPDDVTGYPDVALGRLPANSVDDVSHYVAKLKRYEKRALHGGTGDARQITFFADIAYPYSRDLSQQVIKASGGIASDSDVKRISLEAGKKPQPAPWKAGDSGDIDHAVNHSWWISYVGHGGTLTWGGDSDVYDKDHVFALPANDNQPIVFASACETGTLTSSPPIGEYIAKDGKHWFWFHDDTKTLVDQDELGKSWDFSHKRAPIKIPPPLSVDFLSGAVRTFAYAWLFNPNEGGGIAYLGENQVMENANGVEIEGYALNEYVEGKGVQVLGDIWLNAQRRYCGKYSASASGLDANFTPPRIYLGIIELFGDPSMRLR
jgi:Peptidase family C25